MRNQIFPQLGEALRAARKSKGLTQVQLAKRLGREQGRVSELETDLVRGRLGKDRLTLLVEMCDALDLTPVLLPRAEALSRIRNPPLGSPPVSAHVAPRSTFDELFIDLGEDEEEDEEEDQEEQQAGPHG